MATEHPEKGVPFFRIRDTPPARPPKRWPRSGWDAELPDGLLSRIGRADHIVGGAYSIFLQIFVEKFGGGGKFCNFARPKKSIP